LAGSDFFLTAGLTEGFFEIFLFTASIFTTPFFTALSALFFLDAERVFLVVMDLR
jgi:hypothetical protein